MVRRSTVGLSRSSLLRMLAVVVAGACGSDSPTQNTGGGGGAAPTVVSTNPGSSAAGVSTGTSITATFSAEMDPASINANTFTLSGGVIGTVSYSSLVATFAPAASLAAGTSYTATITTGAKSAAGTPLASSYSWSFTTLAAPIGQIVFPLAVGKKWLYDDTTRGTVCSASGCSTSTFGGQSVLLVDSQLTLGGEQAARVRQFRVAHNGGFDVRTMYLAQRASGLAKYSVSEAAWRTVLSTTSSSFSNGAFLLAGGPVHAAPHTLSTEPVTVPAGSYSAVSSRHSYTETGQFAPADIFETELESFADGVGLLFATQSYSYDDNDPRGIDQSAYSRYALRAVDTFLQPILAAETEANDSGTTALVALPDSVIVSANVAMTDPGAVLSGTAINPDSLGVRRVQDWYRFVAPRSGILNVRLVAERNNVDLDLYVLRTGRAGYDQAGLSTQPAGADETVLVNATIGFTYYIAVQAWNTAGGGRTNYWLYVR